MPNSKRERREKDELKRLRRRSKEYERELLHADRRSEFIEEMQRKAATVRGGCIRRRETLSGLREGTAVALASDWHVGEVVEPEKVAWRNGYDLEVARLRAERFFQGYVWLIRNHQRAFHIRDAILWLGGDIITGYIHEELMETAEVSPIYASRHARSLINSGIRYMLDELDVERIYVLCTHGNHGRTTPKRRISTGAENSYEHLMFLFLADDWESEERVRVVVTKSEQLYYPVYDFETRWMHGDEVRYNNGIGGVFVPLNRAVYRLNELRKAHITNLGHHHSYQSLEHAVVNGSLVGYTPYAQKGTFGYEPPRQAFYVIDSRRGKCMSTPIWVDSSDEAWRQVDEAPIHETERKVCAATDCGREFTGPHNPKQRYCSAKCRERMSKRRQRRRERKEARNAA